ncbi:MAG: LysM domain-containing protein [Sporolactobacillus sp.]
MVKIKGKLLAAVVVVACWTTYSDLTSGTLPQDENGETAQAIGIERATIAYKTVKVEPGDTLLSICERINSGEPNIEQLAKDFALLNPSADANHLKVGQMYAFPYYGNMKNH